MAITKVTNSLVATNAIQGTLIADNAITSVHIAQNQVTSVQIPDSSITAAQLAGTSVGTGQLVNLGVTEAKIANNAVTSYKIATNSVVTETIAQNSITAVQIPDGSITDTQLGSGAFTMGTITTTGAIRGPASLTIDPATVGDNTGTVVIAGNLQVDGTTTTVNSTTLDVADKNITLGKGGSASANNGGGITIDGAAATLNYVHSGTKWEFNKQLDITPASGNTLQVQELGSTSIQLESTGSLRLKPAGGSTDLYYQSNEKLTTKADGVDITGELQADSLDIDGNADITGNLVVAGADHTFYSAGDDIEFNIGRDATQKVNITVNDNNVRLIAQQDSDGGSTHTYSLDRNFAGAGANNFEIQKAGTMQLRLDTSNNATFAGDITTAYTVQAAAYKLGSTVVMNSSRNLTNIGTISSGAITSTGDLLINESGNTERSVRIQNSSATGFFGIEGSSANRFIGSSANNMFLGTTTADGIEFATANTVRATINSSGNATFNGTIKAGNVLSTHGHANADDFIVGNISGSATGLTIVNADGGTGNIHFSDGTSSGNANIQGQLVYAHNDNSMRFYTAVSEKMRLKSTGHLTLNHANHSFSGSNNSLLASSNGYMYAMGGTAGLYLADNSDLSNAIGIRNANYIDFTTSGSSILKFDGDGIHFQKADGQKISAKESIIMQVDADNNTASRVFQVLHGNGKTLLNLHDDYRTEVGTLQYSSTRSAGASQSNGLGASAGDWVDIAAVPYGRNIATIKIFWDAIYAPSSSHHGNMEFDIGSHYGTSYYYGWDTYINLKASSAHNSFFISEARIITPNGSGATGHFQVKFGKATGTQGTLRAYVTHRDEQCSIDPITPVVNNSRSGTTLATIKLDNRPALATSRDFTTTGKMRASAQPAFFATMSTGVTAPSNLNSDIVFNTEVLDQGGCYSGSNGRFTAPCDGVYSFGINLLVYPHTNGVLTPWFYKNGSGYGSTTQQGHEGSSHTGVIRQTIIKLDAGDYVTVRMSLGGGNSGANIYGGQSSFHGHMIG